jgi:hypothetical protein
MRALFCFGKNSKYNGVMITDLKIFMFRHLGDVGTAVVQMESCTGDRQGVLHTAYTALLVSYTVFTVVKIIN